MTYSQDFVNVFSYGTSITRDLTPEEAKSKAIEDAKLNALKKAGIAEQISFTSSLHTLQSSIEYYQMYNEISTAEINGAIVVDSILSEKRSWDQYDNMIIDVEIASTVYKYNTKSDPVFVFEIEGLKEIYYENEKVSFSFTPFHNGYLRIFSLNESSAVILYPYENLSNPYISDDKDNFFLANKSILFPIQKAYRGGYSIYMENKIKDEINTLVFVFLKMNIPANELKTKNQVFRWIYSIPPDQRAVKIHTINLKHNPSQ